MHLRFTFKTIIQLQTFLLSPNMRHDLVRDIKILPSRESLCRLDFGISTVEKQFR